MSGRLFVWASLVGFTLFGTSVTSLEAELTENFGVALAAAELRQAEVFMTESRISQVFQDYLEGVSSARAPKLARHLLSLCRRYGFDPAFVLSLIQTESRFEAAALSSHGAIGLMQVQPATAVHIANRYGFPYAGDHVLIDPFQNLTIGMAYLAELRARYAGLPSYYLLAAYNMGPTKLDQALRNKSFRPVKTLEYYNKIRREIPFFRHYGGSQGRV